MNDPYDNISPRHRWQMRLTHVEAAAAARVAGAGQAARVKVLKRGVSPRIVWADVVGSRGTVKVRGTTLESRLGLYDTWASFNRFSTKTKPKKPATQTPTTPTTPGGGVQAGSFGKRDRIFPSIFHAGRPARLYGSIWPAPRASLASVEKKDRSGRWHKVGQTRLKHGRYNVAVNGSGTFRIALGPLKGPATLVR